MHISPCGWYCFKFQNKNQWELKDTQEKTLLTAADNKSTIELLSARKEKETIDDEISQIHENYLAQEAIIPTRTVFSENPFGIQFYVTRGTGPDERICITGHAFWNNYCIFIQYRGMQHRNSHSSIQTFYDILNSLQPLVES